MDLAKRRLRSQRLVGPRFETPGDAVRWLGAVQAQDYHGAKWALAQRTRGADSPALDRAFDEGALLRTHVLRPTWHLVAPEDLRWLLALTSPRVHAANARMYRTLELDEPVFRRAHDLFTGALRGGRSLTRQELAGVLGAGGIPAQGQRLAYIAMHAELEGLLCSGPLRGRQHTYALLEERVPPAPVPAREEALALLARRYFASHGPATAHDFAWWSGLTVADARAGLELVRAGLEELHAGGRSYWTAVPSGPDGTDGTVVHLLPNYDEHIVAYRDHGPSLDPMVHGTVQGGLGTPLGAHLVARDGLVVGGWRRTLEKRSALVRTELLVELDEPGERALEGALEDYGRFLGLPVVVQETA